MANWIAGAIKKPGSLRATAKRSGLVKGNEPLSASDLTTLAAKGGKTARRANLAKTLKRLDRIRRYEKANTGKAI